MCHTACGVKELPLGSLEKVIVPQVCSRCIQALPSCDKWTSWIPILWCESPHLRSWHIAFLPRNWEGSGFPEQSLHSQTEFDFFFKTEKNTNLVEVRKICSEYIQKIVGTIELDKAYFAAGRIM